MHTNRYTRIARLDLDILEEFYYSDIFKSIPNGFDSKTFWILKIFQYHIFLMCHILPFCVFIHTVTVCRVFVAVRKSHREARARFALMKINFGMKKNRSYRVRNAWDSNDVRPAIVHWCAHKITMHSINISIHRATIILITPIPPLAIKKLKQIYARRKISEIFLLF